MTLQQVILEHLSTRPIASIVGTSMEIDNEIALKMMCIIDHSVHVKRLYPEIESTPKLLEQLLRIRNFGSFHYFEYRLRKSALSNKLLQCMCCEFVAPYIITLEHMVLSHSRHESAKLCQWCKKTDLRNHFDCENLENCYSSYLNRHQINSHYPISTVIDKFYSLMRNIAARLNVNTRHGDLFDARAPKTIPCVVIDDDDDDGYSNETYATPPKTKSLKTFNMDALERMFQEAMYTFNIAYEPDFSGNAEMSMMMNEAASIASPPMSVKPSIPQMSQMPQMPSQMSSQMPSQMPSQMLPMPPMPQQFPEQMNRMREISNFGNFVASALNNMYDDSIRKHAIYQIQQIVLALCAEDMNNHFNF